MKSILNSRPGYFRLDFRRAYLFLSIFLLIVASNRSYSQFIGRIGASVGNGFNNKQIEDVSLGDFKIKDSNLAWKIFVATNWKFIGLEGGYRDFGQIEQDYAAGMATSKSRGGDIFATGKFNLAFVEIFGKAGAFFCRTKSEVYDTSGGKVLNEKDRQTVFAWGLGAALNFGALHIRAEYENMHISPGNLAMLSIGAGINLNKTGKKKD